MKTLLLIVAAISAARCEVLVKCPSGRFKGTTLQTRLGRDIYAFRAMKYAQAPTGKLRFQAPVAVADFGDKVVDATKDGVLCPGTSNARIEDTSEDCLLLNVYTPENPSNITRKLPVVVYIRGGAFIFESGRSVTSGPQYLLDHDVVMVTFNFRQGFLGFLSTGDKLAPGNNGLKDQVEAFKWVTKNIEAFGGDSKSITLLGEDSGALSAGLHLVSPMSKGLFHKVIMMGGAPPVQWSLPKNQLKLAEKKTKALGCKTTSSKSIVDCLQSARTSEYFNHDDELYTFAGQDPFYLYRPVVEGDFGQTRFLIEDPYVSISKGKVMDVPIIAGVTELDLAYNGYVVVSNKTFRTQFNKEWPSIANSAFLIDGDSAKAANTLKKYYLKETELLDNDESAKDLGKLYADAITGFSVNRFVNVMSKAIKSHIYYYKFNYKGADSWYINPKTGKPIGAVHRDDTIYIIQSSTRFTPIGKTGEAADMVNVMTKLWVNFITYSDPSSQKENASGPKVSWPKFDVDSAKYLQINSPKEIASQSHMFKDRYQVWDSLFTVKKD